MSDIVPNLELRKKQIQIRISELKLNLERMDLRKMEMEDERTRIDENIKATNKNLDELKREVN